ncbi:MAG: group III truncated hemoglobin [Acidobacteria bacterium]|nr:group III truncated hemoglobin [Acidobacteriota bacterium]
MTAHTTDIVAHADVVRLVDGFYERVRADDLLGPIFDDIAHTDWEHHLPKMYAFWDTVLFGSAAFRGNPLAVHRTLARQVPLGEREFTRWLTLFHETVDGLMSGPRADEAKLKATRIAAVMQHHIQADGQVGQSA